MIARDGERRTTILVVEDERLVAKDLQARLVELGYDVPATAATVDLALRLASERTPDLVLMDIQLHGERDGIELAAILRERFDVPIVFLSASSDDATVERARKIEPHGYLTKPVKVDELRTTVEVALYKHGMERRLRARERWFATTLRSIGDAVISTDARGLVRFMNPVAERLTGKPLETVEGRPLRDVLRLVDELSRTELDNPIERALETGKVVHLETALLGEGDNARVVHDSAAPIVDDRGAILGAVIVFQDVTDERRLRAQLELADRLASLGTMAAGISHEINNPLTVAYANLRLALEATRRGEVDMRTYLEDALVGVERIQRIVAEISQISSPPVISQRTDVNAVVELAIKFTAHELFGRARIELVLGEVPPVYADDTRLSQVLVNILTNAAHAIPADDPGRHEVRVTTRAIDDTVEIEIRDTGAGMSPDVKRRIFEPFFTTKVAAGTPAGATRGPRGTGLGLAISHGIITSYRGRIEVESTPGAGTTFRVILPTATALPARDESAASAPRELAGEVLVIDDEPVIRRIITRVLARDMVVVAPDTARDALALLRDGRRFDAIVCDLMMPEITGADVYDELVLLAPEQARRMVFVTGGTFDPRALDFIKTIDNPKLDKPFRPDALREIVANIVAAQGRISR